MTINKYIVYVVLVVLAISLYANYHFYSKLNISYAEIEQSKGRVQILEEEKKKSKARIDSLDKVILADTLRTRTTLNNVEPIIKYYAVEKTRVAKLPTDSAISFFSGKLSKKDRP